MAGCWVGCGVERRGASGACRWWGGFTRGKHGTGYNSDTCCIHCSLNNHKEKRNMLFVECKGSPYEVSSPEHVILGIRSRPSGPTRYLWRYYLTQLKIGHEHGTAARTEIGRCITFYAGLFKENCKQEWPEVLQHAQVFEKLAKEKWPAYHEEMRGIADGSERDLLDIVAINVRTEINFGMFSDGCTSLSWQTAKRAYLGQNWDVSE